jgi:hypothetical protein
MHTWLKQQVGFYIQTYIHTCMHACMVETGANIHTCIHAYMHTCTHAHMHANVHTCMHTYIHTYRHQPLPEDHLRIRQENNSNPAHAISRQKQNEAYFVTIMPLYRMHTTEASRVRYPTPTCFHRLAVPSLCRSRS